MNVYATSDFHGQLFDIPTDADLALLAGDVCPDMRAMRSRMDPYGLDKTGQKQAKWLREEFMPWVQRQPCPILMTWGNHDFVGEKGFLWQRIEGMPPVLLDFGYTYGGVKVYGTAMVPGLPYWAFYGDDNELTARAVAIPPRLDVLMTHGPPFGAGDYIPGGSPKQVNKYGNLHGMRVGDSHLRRAIEWARPRVVICGHIHEDRGVHEVDGIPVYNVAAVDGDYEPYGQPWVRLPELESV